MILEVFIEQNADHANAGLEDNNNYVDMLPVSRILTAVFGYMFASYRMNLNVSFVSAPAVDTETL